MSENILARPVRMKYEEPATPVNFDEFEKVVRSRRSVRVFEPTPISDEDVNRAFDMALLAPNSSNLQPWEFYWVKNPQKRQAMVEACLNQQAAKTSAALIVCVARPKNWKKHTRQMIEIFDTQNEVPDVARTYYSKVTYLAYQVGFFSLFKKIILSIAGLFRAVPRGPVNYSELREWAVKSTALGCENLMLAFRALGYDSCPMEGFDEVRVKKILDLPRNAHVVMVIAAGKRAKHGVYGPQIRFPKEQFIKVIE